jgi:hypothetical protein
MNLKRGMAGVWTLISVLWGGYWSNMLITTVADEDRIRFLNFMVYGLLLWWGLLYIGFWISSLFNDNNKKDETNE